MIDPDDDWLNLDSSESEDSNLLLQTTSIDDQGEEIDLFKSNDNSSWQFEEKDLEHFNALHEHSVILHSEQHEGSILLSGQDSDEMADTEVSHDNETNDNEWFSLNMSNLNNALNGLTDELKRHRRIGSYDGSQDYSDDHQEPDHYDDHHDDDHHDDDYHCDDHDDDGMCDDGGDDGGCD